MININKTIFLTGFPGFIAARLVRRMAKTDAQFYLLVQNSFVDKATGEIEKIADETNVPLENFSLIEGDITGKNLGISEKDSQIVFKETTDVFHLAAIYDLAVEKEIAYQVNVEGTKNVNEFVKVLPNLRRYNYVSTCYVSGNREGVIFENELEHDAGFRNFYEETKYLAEMEVEKLKPEFPVTIFRPSVVVGDSKTGETTKYDGVYYLINYLKKFPSVFRFVNVGNRDVRLNLVPVDFVVEGIVSLSDDAKAIGKTIALADPNPLTTEELFDAIAEAMTDKKSVIKPPPELVEKTLMLPFSPLMSGLPHSGVPYFFVPQTYDTSVAEKLLAAHGIVCPSFQTYVKNLLNFVRKKSEIVISLMITRPVIKSDIPNIIKLVGEIWAEYDCVLDLEADDEYLLTPDDYFRSRGREFWVVENENEIVATVAVLMSNEQTAELKSLYVKEDFRRQGLGKDLTKVVIKFVRTKGCNKVVLWSDTRFTKAHRLYKRLGFEKVGSRNLNDLNNSNEFGFKFKIR